jgi:hypothetical protein
LLSHRLDFPEQRKGLIEGGIRNGTRGPLDADIPLQQLRSRSDLTGRPFVGDMAVIECQRMTCVPIPRDKRTTSAPTASSGRAARRPATNALANHAPHDNFARTKEKRRLAQAGASDKMTPSIGRSLSWRRVHIGKVI